ncbi:YlbF family regulator [Paenibacillus sp. JX-17]|uniref:YlbF family regulator n=1 Tax=Paenibacillus lacisoli TaxID=3064525 RepID=A0ABT9C915_9BACL|nr:YlbF family regulator [Paenibacillus sp. JX-17]MDO7905750.1 YlbF family regulator [Paenibacillus sp. JX-17]
MAEEHTAGLNAGGSQELIIRDDILNKARELAQVLGSSEEVQQFQQAEEKINNHQRIQQLIATIKKKQKEIVAFESLKNKSMVDRIEAEIAALQAEIDGIPLVTAYQQSQKEINDLLQLVMSTIRDSVSEKIHVESGSGSASSSCSD